MVGKIEGSEAALLVFFEELELPPFDGEGITFLALAKESHRAGMMGAISIEKIDPPMERKDDDDISSSSKPCDVNDGIDPRPDTDVIECLDAVNDLCSDVLSASVASVFAALSV